MGKIAELGPADAVRAVIIEAVHTAVRNYSYWLSRDVVAQKKLGRVTKKLALVPRSDKHQGVAVCNVYACIALSSVCTVTKFGWSIGRLGEHLASSSAHI
jgi:hypothetical protein